MTDANGVVIRLAGAFTIERNGVPYPRGAVGGKARTVLKLLAAERDALLAADRVAEELWPYGAPKRPVQNVATLVSRLRGALGAGIVTGGRDGYRLGGAPGVRVDLDLAAGLVDEAERCLGAGDPAPAGTAAGRALELLHDGVVLAGEPDTPWVAAARDEAAGLVRRARHVAASAGLHGADFARARRAAEAAILTDPFDEVAYRLLMRAHAAAGEPAKALLVYEELRRRLVAELGTDPAAETRAVHVAVLREEPVTEPSAMGGLGRKAALRDEAGWRVALPEDRGEAAASPEDRRETAAPPEDRRKTGAPPEDRRKTGAPPEDRGETAALPEDRGETGALRREPGRRAALADVSGWRVAPGLGSLVTVARPVLVGRAEEVARISGAWARAVSGRTGVLLVAGEAGIGKSRLAAEAERMAVATGGIVLRARCHEIERALFLQPFVDALRPRLTHLPEEALRDLVGGWAPALRSLEQGQAMERRYAFEAVAAFTRALAAREPVLLVLDDLHAAGPATVELVHYLARRVSEVRLLVLATTLTSEYGVADALRGVSEVLRPGPLTRAAVRELAGGPGLAEEVFLRTQGQPQLVAALLDGSRAGERVPEEVRVIVLARLRGLDEQARRVLRAASVLNGAFDPVVLGKVLDLPPQEVAGHCERALGRGLLVVCGSAYEFANALTRETLYATTPAPTRLVYQRRAAYPAT
ncbi:AAA family ATPase [Nonomuraea insulae]|uniref:AAA family ATPase n=1 Tax=Nonomuraea insulae TaxID=1616787 RepID=A0ABW1CW11_9ACTN